MDVVWKVELLGGLRAVAGSREVTRFQSRQTGLLLAYLAYHCHRAHPREELIELLWPECELEAGRGRLNQAVYSLRRQLTLPGLSGSDVLQADRESLRLNRAYCTTDVAGFDAALTAAKEGSSVERLARLREAVRIYRGELLPGCYSDWCLAERELLAERCIQAFHQLTLLLAQERDFDGALAAARRAVALDPVREESHRILMRVSATAGQLSAALQQYAELQQVLRDELQREPSSRTRQLAQEIREYLECGQPETSWQPEQTRTTGHAVLPLAGTVTVLVADLPPSNVDPRPGAEGAISLRKLLEPLFQTGEGALLAVRGDRLRGVFGRASEALRCALSCRAAVEALGAGMKLRAALHTGETQAGAYDLADDAAGGTRVPDASPTVEHAERLLVAAHPGQIVLSETTAGLLREDRSDFAAPDGGLADLGTFRLQVQRAPERIFQVVVPGEATFPPLQAEPGHAGHLPAAVTRFFGREAELGELTDRLGPSSPESLSRLWTITGPGGTGKTRLAQEIAFRLVGAYRGAVWFAPLEEVVSGDQLWVAIRDVLRLERFTAQPLKDLVVRFLARQPALLILDNFEQIDPSGLEVVQELLQHVPAVMLLVTSRRRLGLPGEREFPLSPLPLPEPAVDPEQVLRAESVRLFVDRAQSVRPDFQLTRHNAVPISELCRRLEGIPLALELAAARTQVLTPAQMLAQLEQRFRFLATSRPNLSQRHRSMQAALDWSYSLLTPPMRSLYARLSLFRGGWSPEAVEGLGLLAADGVPDPIEALAELRESSLVLAEDTGETMRFRMLEMIRQHAAQKLRELGDEAAWYCRHRDWYLARAEAAEAELRGPDQARWLDWLEVEHENMRTALAGSLSRQEGEAALRLAVALCRFWEVRDHAAEGRCWLERALELAGDADPVLQARALNRAGILAREQGDLAAAIDFASRTLDLYRRLDDSRGIAYTLNNLGTLARQQRDYPRALELYGASLELQRQRGDDAAAAVLLNNLGCVAQDQGDYQQAHVYHKESLALQRRLDDRGGIALSLNNLADVARWAGDPREAERLARESLAMFRELGDKTGAAASLHIWGEIRIDRGEWREAEQLLLESLELFREAEDREGVADCLDGLATVAVETGDAGARRAGRLLAASEAIRSGLGSPLPPNVRERYEQRVRAVRDRLGETAWEQVAAEGCRLSWEEAAELALRPPTAAS